jgi:hypothetical protein
VVRALLGLTLLIAACEVEPGHAPVARISATPRAVLENDGFQTEVVLDGSTSADPVDDPEDATPLAYQWVIENDEYRVVTGSLEGERATLTFFGARPATVKLTVTDVDGRTATARLQLQLTVR